MSVSGSPVSEKVGTRFSTPAPELDDHRPRLNTPLRSPEIPSLEVQIATPPARTNTMDTLGLFQVNEVLRQRADQNPVARDFEHAIVDDDKDDEIHPAMSTRKRRLTSRIGRAGQVERHDRSRDTSSSGSTSPANSVDAFAEPRRRQRANTADSRAPSFIEGGRARAYSNVTSQRRPTLSNISIPAALTHDGEIRPEDDVTFPITDEPGKTYRIDFEELDEFVALSEQGLIPEAQDNGRKFGVSAEVPPDRRGSLIAGPLELFSSQESCDLDEKFGEKSRPVAPVLPPRNKFTFFSSEYQGILTAPKLGGFTEDGTSFRDLFELGPEGGVWWLDVKSPTRAELEVICKAFKIHRLTMEDIETQEAREKVEIFSQYYFVCFRSFNPDKHSEDFLEPVHFYVIVCGDGVLTFSYSDTPHARNVRKRIALVKDLMSLGPDWICYALIDNIVDCFMPIIRDAEQESEDIEDQVFIAREDDYLGLLKQIGECRKRILNMMRLLGGKADVIKGFSKRCNESYDVTPRGDIGLYLGDIQDHVVTMMSNLGHVEKMLSRSHANYLAQLNVDNILKGNHTNKALAKITIVATILVPLNLITGLFGMNVPIPGRSTTGLEWFFGIVGVILAISVSCLLIARRFKMI